MGDKQENLLGLFHPWDSVSELWVVETFTGRNMADWSESEPEIPAFPSSSSALKDSVLELKENRGVGIQKYLLSTYTEWDEWFNISIGKVGQSTPESNS